MAGSPVPGDVTQACERCGAGFHCGANDPAPCACTTVQLTPSHHEALRRHYQRCLCMACLAAIAAGEPVVQDAGAGLSG